MRARAIREGSVGLLILIGVGLFGGLVLWLRGLNPGGQTYQLIIEFENTAGMQVGTAVRYRGVSVGRVAAIQPSSNQVQIRVDITQPGLRIPRQVLVEANQSGFIGETTVDITPLSLLTDAEQALSPTAGDCQTSATAILCDGDTLPGEVGVSYEALLRSAEDIAAIFTDPEIIESLKASLRNVEVVTDQVITLTDELTTLTTAAQGELQPLATSARRATDNAAEAAREIQLTATDVRSLLTANRASINGTLVNINRSSDRLLGILNTVETVVNDGELVANLEALSANAATAAANLSVASADVRDITGSLNTPENLLLIQQTLESARDVFQGAQKVLSDVDELTGDPALRNNLRNLINGLSDLLSSSQLLEQQLQLTAALTEVQQVAQPLTVNVPASPPASPVAASYQRFQSQLEALAAANGTTPVTAP
jgi:phospholipid/cholesterol/gamma-HCH transport system substrate-binding protein